MSYTYKALIPRYFGGILYGPVGDHRFIVCDKKFPKGTVGVELLEKSVEQTAIDKQAKKDVAAAKSAATKLANKEAADLKAAAERDLIEAAAELEANAVKVDTALAEIEGKATPATDKSEAEFL